MTRDNLCHAFMVIMGVGAIYLNCAEPMVGRPYGLPATHEPSPQAVLALPGGYQAQGALR